jgi:hypothetical protein
MTMMGGDLTLAELARMVERLGGDPETTIFNTGYGPVLVGEIDLHRENGVVIVDMMWDDPEDGWPDLHEVTDAS